MYRRHLAERQVLGNPFGTTDIAPILSLTLPQPSLTTATTSSSISTLTATSTGTSTSTSTTSSSTSTSSSSSSSSPAAPSPFPTPSTHVFTTVSGDVTPTVTSIVTASSTTTSTPTTTPTTIPPVVAKPSQAFLQNKPLAGAVFGLAGVVVLVIVIIISTLALRRSRRHRLQEVALSFDPDNTTGPGARDTSLEKPTISTSNLAALGSESSLIRHPNYPTMPSNSAPRGQHGFYGQTPAHGYNQPYTSYNMPGNLPYGPPRSPNPMFDSGGQTAGAPTPDPRTNRAPPSVPAQQATPRLTVRPFDGRRESKRASSQQMPVAAPLPDTFGVDDTASGRGSVQAEAPLSGRTLKVANE